jgi:hypothetical protein
MTMTSKKFAEKKKMMETCSKKEGKKNTHTYVHTYTQIKFLQTPSKVAEYTILRNLELQ